MLDASQFAYRVVHIDLILTEGTQRVDNIGMFGRTFVSVTIHHARIV